MNLPAEQAEKLAELERLIEEGPADEKAGRVVPWDFKEFLKRAHEQANRLK